MGEFSNIKHKRKKKSYADLAYDAIKTLILNGEIKSGELVSENQLSEYLNISRTPVREGIRRLEAEGVLSAKQGLGTFLKALTIKDIKDIYEVREALEIIAAETALTHITQTEIDEMRASFCGLLERYQQGEKIEQDEFIQIDGQIHDLIISRSENEYVKILIERINFNIDRFRRISFNVSMNIENSSIQHLELLECMDQRDTKAFKKLISKHIRWSFEILQNNITESLI